jgi:hypothetical protein
MRTKSAAGRPFARASGSQSMRKLMMKVVGMYSQGCRGIGVGGIR